VFVATTKLSASAVRPSSVASSRGGRQTPSISGRITPSTSFTRSRPSFSSMSSGRITPGGRVTPSLPETPAVRAARLRAMANKTNAGVTPTASSKTNAKDLTEGSRAAKYAGMTAQQLSARKGSENQMSPSRSVSASSSIASPTRVNRAVSNASPSRPPGSPFSTPKPRLSIVGNGPNAPSGVTPKPRVPSAVAMPPPPSPSRKLNGDDDALSSSDLEQRGKALQDKIASLTNNKPSSPWGRSSPRRSDRPDSAASTRSSRTDDRELVDQLQSRIAALEYDNERLRSKAESSDSETPTGSDMTELTEAHAAATAKITELEAMLETIDISQATHDAEIADLNAKHADVLKELQDRHGSEQQKITSLENDLSSTRDELRSLKEQAEGSDALVDSLKSQMEEKVAENKKDQEKHVSERTEWESAQSKLKETITTLEDDKKDLGMQVDELRQAGQVNFDLILVWLFIYAFHRKRLHYTRSAFELVR
jgi:CAP-Gly domain-containing linker protein 1